ncbi:SPFH domain-containing protein [Streptomyces sp. NPDC052052]|uniref:SPFH domain-containing protein n=1 Tax=Streptomyces sp. NPDC052052 TaxID=3154756 RepID=UPI00341C4DB3
MGSTVTDSSGTPECGSGREGVRERMWGPDRGTAYDGAGETGAGETGTGSGAGAVRGRVVGTAPASGPGGGTVLAPVPGGASGVGPDAGEGSVVDLVLDLVPGEEADRATLGAASAAVSMPAAAAAAAPVPAPTGRRGADVPGTVFDSLPVAAGAGAEQSGDVLSKAGRHQAVLGQERTRAIPVHLLFRDEAEGTDAAALPAVVIPRGTAGDQQAAVRRPAAPKETQVRPPTRPAPLGDPQLFERSGPALPGWLALFAALAGIAGAGAVLWWAGALPASALARFGIGARRYDGIDLGTGAALAALTALVLLALGGLSRGRVGYAWVLTLFGKYRGTVRRTGLMWVSPLLLRRRIDVRLRHWRSEPLPAVDANGTALRVVVLVVWRIKDTVRATLGVADHEEYLREQVEAAMARVLSQLPADAFHEDAPTLRNAEAVGDALTRMLKADCEPVGIEVYSAQPTGIEYAPEVAAAMQRRRIAAIDAKHRDSVLTSVVDAVDDTVNRLTARGIVELDDYERKLLVKDLTVAFYTGRGAGEGV